MDTLEIILIIVIVSLTTLLVIVGVQVILIISDLRKAVKRINGLLEDSVFGGGLLKPEKLTGIIETFRKNKKLHMKEKGNLQDR